MKRSDDYQNEEFNEESDDYVYIDEDDNAKSAGGSGVVVVLGVCRGAGSGYRRILRVPQTLYPRHGNTG